MNVNNNVRNDQFNSWNVGTRYRMVRILGKGSYGQVTYYIYVHGTQVGERNGQEDHLGDHNDDEDEDDDDKNPGKSPLDIYVFLCICVGR